MPATISYGQCTLRQHFWRSKTYAVAFVSRSSSTSRRQRALDSITTEDKLAKDSKRRRERADSVSETMLQDRRRHLERISEMAQETEKGEAGEEVTGGGEHMDSVILRRIRALGLGQKQRGKDTSRYRRGPKDDAADPSEIGATGFATYMAAASGGGREGWPLFKHMLPEVAFAGHSNCGKSSLVNAVAGMAPRRGLARVSDRAGWTDAVFFYQLGKKPPVLTLADLPGYGHAVASMQQKRRWRDMTNDYFMSRKVLTLCCVLVDCVRGLCKEDQDLLESLRAKGVPVKVILTKGDLLDEVDLARSHALVVRDLQAMGLFDEEGDEGGREGGREDVLMVSSSTGAGVSVLWKALVECTRNDVVFKGDIGLHRASLR
ncbi:gtp-binding protein [Nannochloropsis oceanica]